jgi:hypothetical protein
MSETESAEIPGLASRAESIEAAMRRDHTLPDGGSMMISRIFDISREIPKNVHDLDPTYAEYLSGAMLKGMAMCGELYSLSVSYELRMEAHKKAAYSRAMMVKAAELGLKSAKDREQFAFSDQDFLDAQLKCIEAKMFKTMVEEKKQLFLKAHHLMKDVVSKDTDLVEKTQSVRVDEWGKKITQ